MFQALVAAYCGSLCVCGMGRGGASDGPLVGGASDGELVGGGSDGAIDGGVYCMGGEESSESSGLAVSSGLSSSPVCVWF